ncbi:hypothetical protein JTB14_007705 [Gonioctena quinquepunctata]|nr:hypothetical protein JTB14_007705 [Gonioctena quinquepunctata]
MEGPFGKERYGRLWDELTNILNSMGYQHKSKDKWQKAVADWKSETRAKAADIKINLSKTGDGGQGRQLSEIGERLIGDGNIELGSVSYTYE